MTREEKMAKRREAGKTYLYEPNPFPRGSQEYLEEQSARRHKNISHKPEFVKWRSVWSKINKDFTEQKKIMAQTIQLNKQLW